MQQQLGEVSGCRDIPSTRPVPWVSQIQRTRQEACSLGWGVVVGGEAGCHGGQESLLWTPHKPEPLAPGWNPGHPIPDGLASIRHARNGPSCRPGPQHP